MKRVIIIGAGIAGLSAAVYALQSGFAVTVLEQNSVPGGFCTGWKRQGYLFEGGTHWLTGSSKVSSVHSLWRNLGAIDNGTVIHRDDPFAAYHDHDHDGEREICLYRSPERLLSHWIGAAPEDEREIRALCRDIKALRKVQMPITDIKDVKVLYKRKSAAPRMLHMLPKLPKILKYGGMTVNEYAARFKNPGIRVILKSLLPDGGFPASALMFMLGGFAAGDRGYPEGGSLLMTRKIARRVASLGGEIRFNTRAEKVDIQDGETKGVTVNGKLLPADAVIVTQDTLGAADALFDPPLEAEWLAEMRRDTRLTLNTLVCLGVEADLSNLRGRTIIMPLDEPLVLDDREFTELGFHNCAGYKDYAPKGCTAITVALMGDTYDYWKRLREAGDYGAEKERLAQAIIGILSDKLPQIKGKVAVADVATPLTYERYCGSHRGSWMTMIGKGKQPGPYPCTVEGVSGLYFAGQRLRAPGGMPVAAATGRTAAQYLCRDAGAVFQGVRLN